MTGPRSCWVGEGGRRLDRWRVNRVSRVAGRRGGVAIHDLLRRPEGAEEQVDMERVCQQLQSAEPHKRGARTPILMPFPFLFLFFFLLLMLLLLLIQAEIKRRLAGRSVLHEASWMLSAPHESCVISRWQSELRHQRAVTVCVCEETRVHLATFAAMATKSAGCSQRTPSMRRGRSIVGRRHRCPLPEVASDLAS